MNKNKFDSFKTFSVLQFILLGGLGFVFAMKENGLFGWIVFGIWILGLWFYLESTSLFLSIEKDWVVQRYSFMRFGRFVLGVKNALKFRDYERIKLLLNELENDGFIVDEWMFGDGDERVKTNRE